MCKTNNDINFIQKFVQSLKTKDITIHNPYTKYNLIDTLTIYKTAYLF